MPASRSSRDDITPRLPETVMHELNLMARHFNDSAAMDLRTARVLTEAEMLMEGVVEENKKLERENRELRRRIELLAEVLPPEMKALLDGRAPGKPVSGKKGSSPAV